eukprot:jgi/Chrzof1/10757/Cz05g11040.t1
MDDQQNECPVCHVALPTADALQAHFDRVHPEPAKLRNRDQIKRPWTAASMEEWYTSKSAKRRHAVSDKHAATDKAVEPTCCLCGDPADATAWKELGKLLIADKPQHLSGYVCLSNQPCGPFRRGVADSCCAPTMCGGSLMLLFCLTGLLSAAIIRQ